MEEIQQAIQSIELEQVYGSNMCVYSIIENNQKKLYENQDKILTAIKLLSEQLNK